MNGICIGLSAILLISACTERREHAAAAAAVESELRSSTRSLARPCRNDVLYVDVPLNVHVPWSSTDFAYDVAEDLSALANASGGAWFCGTPGCFTDTVVARFRTVLPPRAAEEAADGDRRFFRFFFQTGRGQPLVLDADAACTAVAALRDSFQLRSGQNWDRTFYTGRECDALPMGGAERAASEAMLSWHLEAIGLDADALPVAPEAGEGEVDIALVDTGVSAAVASSLVASSDFDSSFGGDLHPHGTAMAVLLRQLARDARIHDLRALGWKGHATGEQLARAIDHAIWETGGDPLILSLSLGWPSQLADSALITGPDCTSHEDPFGEPIRYLLDVARRRDESGQRRIFVSAAAGNRPLPVDPSIFPPPVPGWQIQDCAPAPSGPEYFYPAQWQRVSSCRAGDGDSSLRRVALAVGAIDARGEPAVVTIAGAEAPLVAPGEQVLAANHAAPAPSGLPACAIPNAQPTEPELPASLSGTSVSAALVSGAAARAQSLRLALGKSPLSQLHLTQLIYLTGRAVDRQTSDDIPVRRLDIPRLEQAITAEHCVDLPGCGLDGLRPIYPQLLEDCAQALADCGLEVLDNSGNIIPNYLPMQNPPLAPPAGYNPQTCFAGNFQPDLLAQWSCLGSCPDEHGADRHLLGSLGPQPPGDGCPWCYATVMQQASSLKLVLELSSKYPAGTTFSAPWLKVTGVNPVDGSPAGYFVNLLQNVPAQYWGPGKTVTTTLDISEFVIDWSSAKAQLLLTITQPGQIPAQDVSPLTLSEQP